MLSHAWADDTLGMLWFGFAGLALALPPTVAQGAKTAEITVLAAASEKTAAAATEKPAAKPTAAPKPAAATRTKKSTARTAAKPRKPRKKPKGSGA